MKSLFALESAMTMLGLLLLALSISLIPAAVAVSAPSPAAADRCVQMTRGILYSSPSNTKYACRMDGRRLMVDDFGRMTPAPEGVYKKLGDGKECLVGKNGVVLSCNR